MCFAKSAEAPADPRGMSHRKGTVRPCSTTSQECRLRSGITFRSAEPGRRQPAFTAPPVVATGMCANRRQSGSPRTSAEQWWHYSRSCAAALRAGRPPTPIEVYGPVLEPGEQALLSAEIDHTAGFVAEMAGIHRCRWLSRAARRSCSARWRCREW